ncbi:MAG: hypothetical protein AVDCRST_MAG85-1762, partial [uncultured Solirubrobacteraceae bacterium]
CSCHPPRTRGASSSTRASSRRRTAWSASRRRGRWRRTRCSTRRASSCPTGRSTRRPSRCRGSSTSRRPSTRPRCGCSRYARRGPAPCSSAAARGPTSSPRPRCWPAGAAYSLPRPSPCGARRRRASRCASGCGSCVSRTGPARSVSSSSSACSDGV